MTTPHSTSESAGGDGLLVYLAGSLILVVAAEATFIAYPSWWLLAVVLAGVLAAAAGVAMALIRLIDHDTPISASRPKAQAQATIASRPLVSHHRPVVHG